MVIVSSLLFIKNRPQDKNLLAYGENEATKGGIDQNTNTIQIAESTALKSISFYLLLFFLIAITGVGVFTQHVPTYGDLLGLTLNEVGTALSFSSVGMALGSIAIGFVCDKIGSLKTCYILIGIGILAVVGFLLGGMAVPIFIISAFLHGLVTSGIMVLAPILTLAFFGNKDYEKIFAKVSMGAPLASIVLIPGYGYIYDHTKSYSIVLLFLGFLLVFSAICISLGWKKRCTIEGCPRWRS